MLNVSVVNDDMYHQVMLTRLGMKRPPCISATIVQLCDDLRWVQVNVSVVRDNMREEETSITST